MVGTAARLVAVAELYVGPSALWISTGAGTWGCAPGWYMSGLWPSAAVVRAAPESAAVARGAPEAAAAVGVLPAVPIAIQWSAWSRMSRVGPPPWSPIP